MERRVAKVNISSAGGTAASGAKTYKVTVPTTWIDALGIDEGHRELELIFSMQPTYEMVWGKDYPFSKLMWF